MRRWWPRRLRIAAVQLECDELGASIVWRRAARPELRVGLRPRRGEAAADSWSGSSSSVDSPDCGFRLFHSDGTGCGMAANTGTVCCRPRFLRRQERPVALRRHAQTWPSDFGLSPGVTAANLELVAAPDFRTETSGLTLVSSSRAIVACRFRAPNNHHALASIIRGSVRVSGALVDFEELHDFLRRARASQSPARRCWLLCASNTSLTKCADHRPNARSIPRLQTLASAASVHDGDGLFDTTSLS